jgi:altronate hydrolase
MTIANDILQLKPEDNVAVALRDIAAGEIVGPLQACEAIPMGHKIAVRHIERNTEILKYGLPIGIASTDIPAGAHVHTHNLTMPLHHAEAVPVNTYINHIEPAKQAREFMGYKRANGRVGTRNFVGILTSVNCAGTVAKQIAKKFGDQALPQYPNVDGVIALTHTSGCGMSHTGEGIDVLRRTITGYLDHPNFAGVLLIGLGCEVNQLSVLLDSASLQVNSRLRTLGIQESGGSLKAIAAGILEVEALLEIANTDTRSPQAVQQLVLGMQCGGSDGFSGISANPALGVAADILVAHGASVLLSETPEIYGGESSLLSRAISPEVANKLQARIKWWEAYAEKHGTDLNNNPSPGNIAGGITTILEKSLGAVAKGGSAPLTDVLEYAEPLRRKGFQFMDSPGYDPCSATGQMASGANLLCFTTGRGAVYGSKPVPCMKLSSNTKTAERQDDDIDLDCGGVITGTTNVHELGECIFEQLLRIASGEKSKSELLGFGETEFIPWQLGAVM